MQSPIFTKRFQIQSFIKLPCLEDSVLTTSHGYASLNPVPKQGGFRVFFPTAQTTGGRPRGVPAAVLKEEEG